MHHHPRVAALLVAAAMLFVTALGGCTLDGASVDIDGKDIDAVFIHTSDMHSRLIPYTMDVLTMDKNHGMQQQYGPFGGMARLSAVLKQERRNHPRVAYIDTGDVFQGAPIFNAFMGEIEFKALTQLRVDAFTIGNHEFDNGAHAMVKKAVQYANFPMLGGNYSLGDWRRAGITPNGRIAEPYTILNLKGLRVGVIGLASMGGSYGANVKGLVPLNNRKVAQQYVDFLRPIVDLEVVTSHVGAYRGDRPVLRRPPSHRAQPARSGQGLRHHQAGAGARPVQVRHPREAQGRREGVRRAHGLRQPQGHRADQVPAEVRGAGQAELRPGGRGAQLQGQAGAA